MAYPKLYPSYAPKIGNSDSKSARSVTNGSTSKPKKKKRISQNVNVNKYK